jgi:superfamily II DNA/RNA helicase
MTQESIAKKDTQRLQRAIVEGLEDVKAQDIRVFNTEHLSPLFERVIIASGTSNRQTKALAASVRDAVRDAGYDQATEVQQRAIPPALAGADLMVSASTGSGKTASFILPALQRVLTAPRDHWLRVLPRRVSAPASSALQMTARRPR